jgi:hypothetical protein
MGGMSTARTTSLCLCILPVAPSPRRSYSILGIAINNLFVIPQRFICHSERFICHSAALYLSFRSALFVIPSALFVIPQRIICHSAAHYLSFRSALFVIPQRIICHSAAHYLSFRAHYLSFRSALFVIPSALFVIPQRSGGICFFSLQHGLHHYLKCSNISADLPEKTHVKPRRSSIAE